MEPHPKPEEFLQQKPYPADAVRSGLPPAPVPTPAPRPARGRGVFSRYVLPVLLFVLVVGGIAWVAQNMPKWRQENATALPVAGGPGKDGEQALQFSWTRAVWGDPKDPQTVREFERGAPGHYDFPFRNLSGQDVRVGLVRKGCDCMNVQVCLLSPADWEQAEKALREKPGDDPPLPANPGWRPLDTSDASAVPVPADGRGVVRVGWNTRKNAGEPLNLKLELWTEPTARPGWRFKDGLEVPIMAAAPYYYDPDKVSVGILGSRDVGVAEFDIWSSTRADLNLKFQGGEADPLFVVEGRKLAPDELARLQDRLTQQKIPSKPVSAYHVTVTVYEQKGGREMEQGPFRRHVPIWLDEVLVTENPGPLVYGMVKGEVQIGAAEDQGRINLKTFAGSEGTRRVVPLWADPKVTLKEHSQQPAYLEVKLDRDPKGSTPQRAKWLLRVTVPPNTALGPFPDAAAITLQIDASPPRFIRIPITGQASAN